MSETNDDFDESSRCNIQNDIEEPSRNIHLMRVLLVFCGVIAFVIALGNFDMVKIETQEAYQEIERLGVELNKSYEELREQLRNPNYCIN